MKSLAAIAASVALVLALAAPAAAGEKRNDTYYTAHCTDPAGNEVDAESVDAHAIEQGGKVAAIQHWLRAHPDWACTIEGPFGT